MIVALHPISSLAAQPDAFLEWKGIKGETEVKEQGKGWTEIQGWDWGANDSASICRDAASGQATGRRHYAPVVFKKSIDKSTPLLHKALVDHGTIESALLLIKQADGR